MSEKLTLDSFQPLIEAMEESRTTAAAFLDGRGRAVSLLHSIKARQAADRQKYSEMLSGLKAEGKRIRQKVREDTANRARAAAKGEAAPLADVSTGARLAALPDEIAALEALIAEQRMTDEEREKWTKTVIELRELEAAHKRASRTEREELTRWKVYFFEAVNYPEWGINTDTSGLIAEGYALNGNADDGPDSGGDN